MRSPARRSLMRSRHDSVSTARLHAYRKDSEGRTPRVYHCPVTHCKRHRRVFGRQWNMTQHCQKVHGGPPSQFCSNKTDTGSPKASNQDLRAKLEQEYQDAISERAKILQDTDDQIKKLESEKDSAIQKLNEKILAMETLRSVLGEDERLA